MIFKNIQKPGFLSPENAVIDETALSVSYFCCKNTIKLDNDVLELLVQESERSGNCNVRICLHRSPEDNFHEMIILQRGGCYYRPHKHQNKGESWHILTGEIAVFLFDDSGQVEQYWIQARDKNIIGRIGKNKWHLIMPLSKYAIYHESKPGPYLGNKDSIFPDWAPDGTNPEKAEEYMQWLKNMAMKSADNYRPRSRVHKSEPNRKKVLITGAGGFVGRFLAQSFLKDGHEVLAAYRTMNPGLQQVRCKKVQVDLMDSLDGLEPVDIIIHAAAAHVASNPVPDLNSYIHSNVIATKHMADYAAAGRTQLFIYLSTVSVYGAVEGGVLSEGTPVNSPNMYGASKYMAELILKEYQQQFPSICVRLPGITGKGSLNLWLGSVMERAIKGQPIKIYNGDSMFNNVVDRADLMRFVSACIDREDWSFNIFNLAASNPITVREVVKLIISLTGSSSEIVEKEVTRQSFFISNEKLRNVLDFVPETTGTLVSRFVRANLETTKFNHDAGRHGHLKEINK